MTHTSTASSLDSTYYQGYFFCKPHILSQKTIPANRLSTLHLLARLTDPNIRMDSLELAVGQNLTISYRILRYLNSPLHGFSRRIESLRHGIALVGLKLISEWASMLLLDSIDEKPRELIITSMIRGHMCRLTGNRDATTECRSVLYCRPALVNRCSHGPAAA